MKNEAPRRPFLVMLYMVPIVAFIGITLLFGATVWSRIRERLESAVGVAYTVAAAEQSGLSFVQGQGRGAQPPRPRRTL